MHELSLALRMLDLADEAARAEGATRVDVVHVEIGALAGVAPEALAFAFEAAREGTIAAGARLEVIALPAIAYCSACAAPFQLDNHFGLAVCPRCARPSADLRQGREMRVTHLEVT